MPLTEEEWNNSQGASSWTKMIHGFLEDEYPKAYSVDEIVEEFFDLSRINMGNDEVVDAIFATYVQSLLEYLVSEGKVESKVNTGSGYEETYFRKSEK